MDVSIEQQVLDRFLDRIAVAGIDANVVEQLSMEIRSESPPSAESIVAILEGQTGEVGG